MGFKSINAVFLIWTLVACSTAAAKKSQGAPSSPNSTAAAASSAADATAATTPAPAKPAPVPATQPASGPAKASPDTGTGPASTAAAEGGTGAAATTTQTGMDSGSSTSNASGTSAVDPPAGRFNYVLNPSFEFDTVVTTTITDWLTSAQGDSVNANYADTNAGAIFGKMAGVHYAGFPYEVNTYQDLTNLPLGTYTLSAYVQSSGGQTSATMYAVNEGTGNEHLVLAIPTSSTWVKITIPNIPAPSGAIKVGFGSLDPVGNHWIKFDNVVLTHN